jgi:hypothetical protein
MNRMGGVLLKVHGFLPLVVRGSRVFDVKEPVADFFHYFYILTGDDLIFQAGYQEAMKPFDRLYFIQRFTIDQPAVEGYRLRSAQVSVGFDPCDIFLDSFNGLTNCGSVSDQFHERSLGAGFMLKL